MKTPCRLYVDYTLCIQNTLSTIPFVFKTPCRLYPLHFKHPVDYTPWIPNTLSTIPLYFQTPCRLHPLYFKHPVDYTPSSLEPKSQNGLNLYDLSQIDVLATPSSVPLSLPPSFPRTQPMSKARRIQKHGSQPQWSSAALVVCRNPLPLSLPLPPSPSRP